MLSNIIFIQWTSSFLDFADFFNINYGYLTPQWVNDIIPYRCHDLPLFLVPMEYWTIVTLKYMNHLTKIIYKYEILTMFSNYYELYCNLSQWDVLGKAMESCFIMHMGLTKTSFA